MRIAFHHPAMVVPDLERAVTFYESALGFSVLMSGSWESSSIMDQVVGLAGTAAKMCMMHGAGTYLELFEYAAPVPDQSQTATTGANAPGIRHLAFEVDDMEAAVARFLAAGGSAQNEPAQVKGGGQATYLRDPFGNLIELVVAGGRFPSRLGAE